MLRAGRNCVFAAVALAMLMGTWARAQVLQQLPGDALVVIKVKNLQDVNTKIAALSQQWGLNNFFPQLNDPLGTMLTAANLGPGIDKAGEAAVAIMQNDPNAGPAPKMVMLIPVSDFKAFAGALPNAKAEGDLTSFSMGGNPTPAYAASWGKFAAVSPQKEMLAKAGTGIKIAGPAAKELDTKDLVVYTNLQAVGKQALPALQQNKAQILQAMEAGIANAPGANPKFMPAFKAYMSQILAAGEAFLRDGRSATFGINLSKDGISTTALAEFDPASYAGKAIAGFKNTDASFTAGLPDTKYFFYGGWTMGESGAQMISDFVAPIEKELAALGDEGKGATTYMTAFRSFLGALKQGNMGMVAPAAAAIQQQGIIQVVSVARGDTAKMHAAQKQMLTTQNDIMKLMGADAMGVKTTTTPNAKTVDGVSFDSYATTFDGQPQTPQQQAMVQMMKTFYGANGASGYIGSLGADQMLMVLGGGDDLLNSAVKAAKAGEDPLGKGAAAKVSAAMPQSREAAFYLSIDTIATTVLDFMAAQGMPVGVKLPPNLPPLGGTMSSEGSSIRFDGYVPAQTVQSLISAGMQVQQRMQGGGGQPGGL